MHGKGEVARDLMRDGRQPINTERRDLEEEKGIKGKEQFSTVLATIVGSQGIQLSIARTRRKGKGKGNLTREKERGSKEIVTIVANRDIGQSIVPTREREKVEQ